MLSQKDLRKTFHYNSESGEFTRLDSKGIRQVLKTTSQGYVKICFQGKTYGAHILAWVYTYGEKPNCIDHINRDRADNRIVNLRNVTHAENNKNRPMQCNNSSGVTGVKRSKDGKKWIAEIGSGNRCWYLGTHATKESAIKIRKEMEKKLGFYTAR